MGLFKKKEEFKKVEPFEPYVEELPKGGVQPVTPQEVPQLQPAQPMLQPMAQPPAQPMPQAQPQPYQPQPQFQQQVQPAQPAQPEPQYVEVPVFLTDETLASMVYECNRLVRQQTALLSEVVEYLKLRR